MQHICCGAVREDDGRKHCLGESNVAIVGNFNADNGLNVNNWHRDDRNDDIWAAPLIVFRRLLRRNVFRLLCGSNPPTEHFTDFLQVGLQFQVSAGRQGMRVFCKPEKCFEKVCFDAHLFENCEPVRRKRDRKEKL